MKKIFLSILSAIFLFSLLGPLNVASAHPAPVLRRLPAPQQKIAPALRITLNGLQAADTVTVIVTLRQQADLSRLPGLDRAARNQGAIRALQATANATQPRIRKLLDARLAQGSVKAYRSLWVFNGFSVTATRAAIDELARQPDIYSIAPDDLSIVPASGPAEPNIALVNAPALWNLGYTGQGVVVANMDSGVDATHPDLSTRWRGGANSWFDPYGQHTTPADLTGHGTQTMGLMVGGDAGGTSLGMAPGASWIAVKIFNDAGSSTATAIHQGFQWLLDPDGNPATADAPNVVNNSWTFATPGCSLDFELDLQSLRAAGILPVFAAGNGGPYSSSSYSPANNPSALAVGAINNNSGIYGYSSRGPTTCGGSTGPFPELVAPGVYVNTTDLYSLYTNAYAGTSYAAPHVAGGLALLLSAYPNLSAADQQNALTYSAVDLGASGPDDVYGYGRLDILAAFHWLASNPTPTPGPTDTPAPLPTATFTSTPLPTATWTSTPLPTATFTATPAATMHVGDLDRSANLSGAKWNASVTINVQNAAEGVLAGVTVTGKWTNGATGTVTCTTNTSGTCTISKTGLGAKTTSVTFTVTSLTKSGWTYSSASNHDPDGDSTGTVIVVARP